MQQFVFKVYSYLSVKRSVCLCMHRAGSPVSSYKELKNLVLDKQQEEELEEQRRKIHQWMSDKYTQRQSEYHQHRMDLQEREVNPYKPSTQVGVFWGCVFVFIYYVYVCVRLFV